MFEELKDLQGQIFDLTQGSCLRQFAGFQTICYGFDHYYSTRGERWFIKYFFTDENDQTIGFSNISEPAFFSCNDDVQSPDASIYPDPERVLLKRIFEYEWYIT